MVQGSMEDGSLFSWKTLYQKKGYYRKVVFLVLVSMYIASVCGILVLKAESFRTREDTVPKQREGRRVRRSAVLEEQPLTEGTYLSFVAKKACPEGSDHQVRHRPACSVTDAS